jgi:hypothetical protein
MIYSSLSWSNHWLLRLVLFSSIFLSHSAAFAQATDIEMIKGTLEQMDRSGNNLKMGEENSFRVKGTPPFASEIAAGDSIQEWGHRDHYPESYGTGETNRKIILYVFKPTSVYSVQQLDHPRRPDQGGLTGL